MDSFFFQIASYKFFADRTPVRISQLSIADQRRRDPDVLRSMLLDDLGLQGPHGWLRNPFTAAPLPENKKIRMVFSSMKLRYHPAHTRPVVADQNENVFGYERQTREMVDNFNMG
jgi:hypothetical protein